MSAPGKKTEDSGNVAGQSSTSCTSIPRYSLRAHKEKQGRKESEIETSHGFLVSIQPPSVYINPHLSKVKMECDFLPLFGPKEEPVSQSNDFEQDQVADADAEPDQSKKLDFQKKNKNKRRSLETCESHSQLYSQSQLHEGNEGCLKSELEMKIRTMELRVEAMHVLARKLPSDAKLPLALGKIRAALAEYKSVVNSESNLELENPDPTPAKKVKLTEEPQTEIEEPASKIQQLAENKIVQDKADETGDKDKEKKTFKLIQKYASAHVNVNANSNGKRNRIPSKSCLISKLWGKKARELFFKNDFLQLPSDFHFELNKLKNEKVVLLEKLKEWFSGFGLISKVIVTSLFDFNLFCDLQILGEKISHVKIKLAYTFYLDCAMISLDRLLDPVLRKCPNLNFLDIEMEKGEISKSLNHSEKLAFALFLMKTCNRIKNKYPNHQSLKITIFELVVDLNFMTNDKGKEEIISIYKTFAESGVRVNHLEISHQHFKSKFTSFALHFLKNVLEASKDVLYGFKYSSKSNSKSDSVSEFGLHILNQVKFPLLPNLQTLEISTKL